jgi:hypothetical protein
VNRVLIGCGEGVAAPPTGGAKSKYLGRGHFFPFLEKAHHQGDERK